MRHLLLIALLAVSGCAARHGGAVIDTGEKPPNVGGTIAGIVSTSGGGVALSGRKVTAIEQSSGARFEATTAINGGYTIKVPTGTYRIEVELRPGETLTKRPDPTTVNVSDLDEAKNFEITAGTAR